MQFRIYRFLGHLNKIKFEQTHKKFPKIICGNFIGLKFLKQIFFQSNCLRRAVSVLFSNVDQENILSENHLNLKI